MGMIYAISDIHGYYDIMEKTLGQVDLKEADNKLILCGDYIDYGPESCRVLYRIKGLTETYPGQVIALKGNHEAMFLEFLDSDDLDVWNVDWLGADKELSTINTFISDKLRDQIKKMKIGEALESAYKLAKLIKNDIKTHHKELIKWLRSLPLYYETKTQIFVHAGIDEEAGEWWKFGTSEETFLGKYPATLGRFYKDIIAGHVGVSTLKGERGFCGVFWDGKSHYYIDGSVEVSGEIPLLKYDVARRMYII